MNFFKKKTYEIEITFQLKGNLNGFVLYLRRKGYFYNKLEKFIIQISKTYSNKINLIEILREDEDSDWKMEIVILLSKSDERFPSKSYVMNAMVYYF